MQQTAYAIGKLDGDPISIALLRDNFLPSPRVFSKARGHLEDHPSHHHLEAIWKGSHNHAGLTITMVLKDLGVLGSHPPSSALPLVLFRFEA